MRNEFIERKKYEKNERIEREYENEMRSKTNL